MARFSSPVKQAASVIKALQGHTVKSVGTVRNYEAALARVAYYLSANKLGTLRGLTIQAAVSYLSQRAKEVGQSQLNMERQAMQMMMKNVTQQLDNKNNIEVIKSNTVTKLKTRAYTWLQVELIAKCQQEKNSLATKIAYETGLRAHELYTLLPINERQADVRPALASKFIGRAGQFYTVIGKGGLVRAILISSNLAKRLEKLRLNAPAQVTDRGIHYTQYYAINAGNRWSACFTAASKRALGHSNGAHGLRHSYAQERMQELKQKGLSRDRALETVSQELGHFRADITEVYLR
jgi:integrase